MAAQGKRIEWAEVPGDVRVEVAQSLGSPVEIAVNEPGGFSPGVAARCGLADGRRCFIKAVSPEQNPVSPGMHRREADISAQLPTGLPVPRLITVVDNGHWIVVVFEEIEGRPPSLPWSLDELSSAFAAIDDLAAATTPCPVPDLPPLVELFIDDFTQYRRLAGGDPLIDSVDPWTRRHLDLLAAMEAEWELAAAGDSLVHADVRADNLLIRADGSVVLVDWPHACTGPSWADKAFMLPSVGLSGGPSPVEVEEQLGPFDGVDPDVVNRVLVALTGYFSVRGLEADPPGLPTLRAFQRDQGEIGRYWLAHRLGLD